MRFIGRRYNRNLPLPQQEYYAVTDVVDGDTIKIRMGKKDETLRLIGMDTPETVDPRKPIQCFGREASNKAKELLSGRKVRIEMDPTQGDRDKYGRLLAYVHRDDGLFYNEYMIRQGYAHEYTYDTPYKYQTTFKAAQISAEAAQLGLWSPGETEDLTLRGKFWSLERAFITPKPRYGRPILVNATGSPAGVNYAAAHSDLVFITSPAGHEIDAALAALPAHNAVIKAAGAERGRKLRTTINPMIVCRETDREARQYHAAILDAADHGAVEGFVSHQRSGDAVAWKAHGDKHRALGGNIQIIGSPEHVVDKLVGLKRAGCDGIQVAFFDFAPDLEFFGEAVLPLMHQAGLRVHDGCGTSPDSSLAAAPA